MRYFVTGATGFVGGALARLLVEEGHQIVCPVRNLEEATSLAELGAAVHEGDITIKESLRESMSGVDGVFHVAEWNKLGSRAESTAEKVNVEGTRNVLELMAELAIPKGVYTSTVEIYGHTEWKAVTEERPAPRPPYSIYGRSKWKAHYEVALPMIRDGAPLVIVLPGLAYGPRDPGIFGKLWVEYLRRKLPAIYKDLKLSWTHVDDVAAGHLGAMERGEPGASYHLAGPGHSLVEALALAEELTGIPAPKRQISGNVAQVLAGLLSVIETFRDMPPSYHPETLRECANRSYLGESSKAERALGWKARDLRAGLEETLAEQAQRLGIELPASR